MKLKNLTLIVSLLAFTACLNVQGLSTFAADDSSAPAPAERDYYRETQAGNYLSSRFAQSTQDWGKASDFIGRLVALDPKNDTLQQKAMVLAMGSGEVNRAYALARKVMDRNPQNFWAMLFVSLEALSHQDYTNARTILSSAGPDDIAGFITPVLMTWIEAAEGRINKTVPEKNTLHAFHIILAAAYLGQINALPDALKDKIKTDVFEQQERERIADIFVEAGLYKDGLTLYRELLKDNPAQKNLSEKIARADSKKPITDLLTYKPVTSPSEGLALALFDVSRILYSEYNDESAQIFAQMALALDPAMTQAKVLLAHMQTRYGHPGKAIAYYQAIDKNDPNFLDVQHQIADLMEDTGRKDEAIALLNRLIDDHDDTEALIQLGDLYRRDEQYALAIKTYDKALKHQKEGAPDPYWGVYYVRGMAYEQLDDWPHAQADLTKALEYSPNNPYLLNYLGYSMADRGLDLERSLDMIQKAVLLVPQDGYITDSLGWVYFRMGAFDKSVEPLERAVELVPFDPVINDHLGDAYWRVGRKMEARFQWKRALNHAEEPAAIDAITHKLQYGLAAPDKKGVSLKEASSGTYESLNP